MAKVKDSGPKNIIKIEGEISDIEISIGSSKDNETDAIPKITVDWGEGIKPKTLVYKDGQWHIKGAKYDWGKYGARVITIEGNVKIYDCRENRMQVLDLSQCSTLTELNCFGCSKITSLDVSKQIALEKLICTRNQLSTLDVSANTTLKELQCSLNQLTKLDVSANTALTDLECSNNQLPTLDVSKNVALKLLFCGDNKLSTLDVSANVELNRLECSNNKLTKLDLSANKNIVNLGCQDNLLDADALNDLFKTLRTGTCYININGNPGVDKCDCSIAEKKGWKVYK